MSSDDLWALSSAALFVVGAILARFLVRRGFALWDLAARWFRQRVPLRERPVHGRVVGPEQCRGPITGALCVGYSLHIGRSRRRRSTRTSLTTALSGLRVELDDGRELWIAAEQLHIDWRRARRRTRRVLPAAGLRAEEYLLCAGDDVELRGEPPAMVAVDATPYRTAARGRRTAGAAELRVL